MINWADLSSIDPNSTQSRNFLALRKLYKYADGEWWTWHHCLIQVQDGKVNVVFALHFTNPVL